MTCFCLVAYGKISSDPTFLRRIVFSNKDGFHVSETYNTHDTRVWGSKNPRKIQERKAHSIIFSVWWAIQAKRLLHPYSFCHESVRKDNFLSAEHFWPIRRWSILTKYALSTRRALPHTSREIRSLFNDLFSNFGIGRYGPREWHARSLKLTPPDGFLGNLYKIKFSRPLWVT